MASGVMQVWKFRWLLINGAAYIMPKRGIMANGILSQSYSFDMFRARLKDLKQFDSNYDSVIVLVNSLISIL